MACSTGCATPGAHASFGECLRAKHLQLPSPAALVRNRALWGELDAYRSARQAGIQPASTRLGDVQRAVRASEQAGVAYRADR